MSSKVTKLLAPTSELDVVQEYRAQLKNLEQSPDVTVKCIRTIVHLITWLSSVGKRIEHLDIRVLHQFLNHNCACPKPHGYRKDIGRARGALHRFLGFLIEIGRVRIPPSIEAGGKVVESFLQFLQEQGYVSDSIAAYRKRCRHFIVWLYLNDVTLAGVSDAVLSRFLSHDCHCIHPQFFVGTNRFAGSDNSRFKLGVFINYLIDTGIAPPRPTLSSSEPGQYLSRFENWLRQYRGITDSTIDSYGKAIEVFIGYLGDDPDQYTATRMQKTVQLRLENDSHQLVRRESSALRLYLQFLALEGVCRPGLAGAVPTIPRQPLSTMPRYLPYEDIERIIASCDPSTAKGMRDRAILLLLARLAFRAGDVAGLELNDIDWERALVRVRGKSQREAMLPLPQDVGDAIRNYILRARAATSTEKVFLRTLPPLHQPLSGGGVSAVAKAAIRCSGVKADGLPAAHLFRHSAATNLLRDGTPLEVISSLLRHQSVSTTAVYARVDIPMLLEVAQHWPTSGGAK